MRPSPTATSHTSHTFRRRAGPLALAALLCLVPAGAAGQVEGSGGAGRYFLDIEALPAADDGWGFDGSVRVHLGDRFRIGAGVQYNAHTVGGGSDRYEVVVPFVEARVAFPTGSRWEPFLAARVGAVRHSLRILGQEVSGTGRVLGGLAGVALRLTAGLSVEASGSLYHATVDDVEIDLGGVAIVPEDLSARALGVRLGLAWRPGS